MGADRRRDERSRREHDDRRARVLVEDSSDGTAWLIAGGAHGLVLDHVETGARVREPYLVLSKRAI